VTPPRAERRLRRLLAGHRATVVGIGNVWRGDDGVGPRVAERLAARFPSRVIDAGCVPENYVAPIIGTAPEVVVFVDAVDTGAAAGDWCVLSPSALRSRAGSTHVGTLRPLARLLAHRGIRSCVVAVEPGRLDDGAPLSPPVATSADRLVTLLGGALAPDRAPEVHDA